MHIDFLLDIFEEYRDKEAIVWNNETVNYKQLCNKIAWWREVVDGKGIHEGSVVALEGDFSPNSIALLLVLIERACIVVPLTNKEINNKNRLFDIAQIEFLIRVDASDRVTSASYTNMADNHLYNEIKERKTPGLVLFTSGTSGLPKAAVHDISLLLEKFKVRRMALRTLNFLLFDHWGGLNTMFHILSNAGVVITADDRTPENISKLVEKHRIELLPASPTFLKLLLLSGAYSSYDMRSLKMISYGTEPMPESTLKMLKNIFPDVKLLQTYGLIELGVLRSKSEKDDSLWVKVGGEGYETRVVDGLLEIKAKSAMLGYLNAQSPFTEDGWFKTGDAVESKGDYIKILGRRSELINVGGEKVYPQEVESVIQEMDGVVDVTVYGEQNSILGSIVCAKVVLLGDAKRGDFSNEVKQFCSGRMKKFMIPIKVEISDEKLHGSRFKKNRAVANNNA